MIESMFLGIFVGMFSCFSALMVNYALTHDQDHVDPDRFISLSKTSLYLFALMLTCTGAAFGFAIGSLEVTVYTLFGLFAFFVADELMNSSMFAGLVGEAE